MKRILMLLALCAISARAQEAQPTDAAAELAKKLANPVAALISVPLQYNYDENFGVDDQGSEDAIHMAMARQ